MMPETVDAGEWVSVMWAQHPPQVHHAAAK